MVELLYCQPSDFARPRGTNQGEENVTLSDCTGEFVRKPVAGSNLFRIQEHHPLAVSISANLPEGEGSRVIFLSMTDEYSFRRPRHRSSRWMIASTRRPVQKRTCTDCRPNPERKIWFLPLPSRPLQSIGHHVETNKSPHWPES